MTLDRALAYPLQYVFSGPLELLIATVVFLLIILVPAFLVYRDAKKRDMNAALWGVVVGGLLFVGLIPGIAAIAYYLYRREDAT